MSLAADLFKYWLLQQQIKIHMKRKHAYEICCEILTAVKMVIFIDAVRTKKYSFIYQIQFAY